jgi:hypothetical protein
MGALNERKLPLVPSPGIKTSTEIGNGKYEFSLKVKKETHPR